MFGVRVGVLICAMVSSLVEDKEQEQDQEEREEEDGEGGITPGTGGGKLLFF